eukprot:TRINITY_DN6589_c0_g1_i2.p1 TRINITY_DN6589_c0_g1~~TRINITY_DN6589_c0_g1_i2.p1  ORF type:complete len:175 (+),score=26.96 TRINITY_DN6589_c0_g1_i2:136-660(+)
MGLSPNWAVALAFVSVAGIVFFYIDGSHRHSCSSDVAALRQELRFFQQSSMKISADDAECMIALNESNLALDESNLKLTGFRESLANVTKECESRIDAINTQCGAGTQDLASKLVAATSATTECAAQLQAAQQAAQAAASKPVRKIGDCAFALAEQCYVHGSGLVRKQSHRIRA